MDKKTDCINSGVSAKTCFCAISTGYSKSGIFDGCGQ